MQAGCDTALRAWPARRPPAPQRGNRRERTLFEEADYALYLDLLAQAAGRHGVEVWSCCLTPNHVHIVAVPRDEDALGCTFRDVHRSYTRPPDLDQAKNSRPKRAKVG